MGLQEGKKIYLKFSVLSFGVLTKLEPTASVSASSSMLATFIACVGVREQVNSAMSFPNLSARALAAATGSLNLH